MTGLGQLLNDEEVAAVITYVRQSFGNNYPAVKPAQVKKVREAIQGKNNGLSTVEEVLKELRGKTLLIVDDTSEIVTVIKTMAVFVVIGLFYAFGIV